MIQKICLLWTFLWMYSFFGYSLSQTQNAIGAHRIFDKTSFTCVGRPAGYYADIETGCQVYHMCDGLGRQFSYSCPNTTLFQQRMLICDHWYMVNCSKAESDYAANLLIGQRDKPFVPDDENHLRTPRPDLLDRPYAPDYSGESYRSQYKNLQNEIGDNERTIGIQPMATKWSIPQPSSFILPPAPPETISLESENKTDVTNRKPIASIQSVLLSNPNKMDTISKNLHLTSSATPQSSGRNEPIKFNSFSRSQVIVNQNEIFKSDEDDLGTSFSSRYNTTSDILADRIEKNAKRKNSIPEINKETKIYPPSKVYEPPLLYPIYNENYVEESLENHHSTTTKMMTSKIVHPTTNPIFSGQPFTKITITSPSTSTQFNHKNSENIEKKLGRTTKPDTNASQNKRLHKITENSKPLLTTTEKLTTTSPSINSLTETLNYNILKEKILDQPPSPFVLNNEKPHITLHLLPPFEEFILHDTATTQGPPIYYEWKIPSNALQPPKSDPPIGVDGRKEDNKTYSYDTNVTKTETPNFNITTYVESNQKTNDLSTSRSIKNTSTTLSSPRLRKATNKTKSTNFTTDNEIHQLKKDLLIPEFLFPLESVGRTGYEHSDTVNSFQLKIPEKRIENQNSWYGENPQCPECHPSFVKPGTCEPCIKR